MTASGAIPSSISAEVCWTAWLRATAAQAFTAERCAARGRDVAALLRNAAARERFERRWQVWRQYFERCARDPMRFVESPEQIDEALIVLETITMHADGTAWPAIHRIADAIRTIADATRTTRMHLYGAQRAPRIATA